MATYKAEFLSHYYERRLRPRPPTRGADPLLRRGSPRARRALANLLPQRGPSARWAERAAGIAPQRELPAFARADVPRLVGGAAARATPAGRRVLLWPDTFNNFFHPEVAIAAVEVLEAAGFEVVVPERHAVLRAAAVRLRDARRSRERQLRQILDGAAAGDPGGHARRRAGAELRRGVPRRAHRCCPTTRTPSG